MEAKINNVWHKVKLIDTDTIRGVKVIKVQVVDGTKPFVSCQWSAPFVHGEEGYVLPSGLRVS